MVKVTRGNLYGGMISFDLGFKQIILVLLWRTMIQKDKAKEVHN